MDENQFTPGYERDTPACEIDFSSPVSIKDKECSDELINVSIALHLVSHLSI